MGGSGADASLKAEAYWEHVTNGGRSQAPTSPAIESNAGVAGRGAATYEKEG